MTESGQAYKTSPGAAEPSREEARALVERYSLKRAGARASLSDYTRELWRRRYFIAEFSRATNASSYSRAMLGQAWQVLTPLLNAAVYYVIFGLLLHISRGIDNYIGFLVTGVFAYHFVQGSVNGGARSLQTNRSLARTLRFPRAVFPLSATAVALEQLVMSLVVLLPIVLLTGEPLRWQWLTVIPLLGLQTLFCTGIAFIFARIGSKVPDISQMLPFALRVWFYASGIMFSIPTFTKERHHEQLGEIMQLNPVTVYVDLYRSAFIESGPAATAREWLLAIAWGVVVLAVGYVFFWRAEEEYGRD